MCHLANVLQWADDEAQGLLKAESPAILGLLGSNQFCHVLWPCHSFKGCALPPSLHFKRTTAFIKVTLLNWFYLYMNLKNIWFLMCLGVLGIFNLALISL